MTPSDLRAWMERRDLTQGDAAALLGTSQATVSRWASEDPKKRRRIPGPVLRLIECLDRADTLERAATGAAEER